MTTFDPQYATQAFAWLVVWGAAGLAGRQYLAGKEADRRRAAGSKRSR